MCMTLGWRVVLGTLLAGSMLGPATAQSPTLLAAPVVQTATGAVVGLQDNGVLAYKGIPYAASAGGAHRFLPPVEREPWAGVYDASAFGPACPQYPAALIGSRAQSEDCLRLNVWTAAVTGS